MALSWHRLKAQDALDAWRQISRQCSYATFFETEEWADALRAAFPAWSPDPIAVQFSDGNLMVIPVIRRKAFGGAVRYGEGMLPGVYGGPLFLRPPREEHLRVVGKVANQANTIIHTNPYLPEAGWLPASARVGSTRVVDLSAGIDAIRKGIEAEQRRRTRVAVRKGVEVRLAACTKEVRAYYGVYQDTLRRWGKMATGFYPERLFTSLMALPGYGSRVRLWTTVLDGRLIGGLWALYHGDHAVGWHSCYHSEYYKAYHPAHLLTSTVIEEAGRAGFRWFDFNPSAGLKGVEQFKISFGAQRLEFPVYRHLTPGGKAFRVWRHLSERYLHRCPL